MKFGNWSGVAGDRWVEREGLASGNQPSSGTGMDALVVMVMMLVVRRRAVVVLVERGWLFWRFVVARASRGRRTIVAGMRVVAVLTSALIACVGRVASRLMRPRHGVGQREADQHGEEQK